MDASEPRGRQDMDHDNDDLEPTTIALPTPPQSHGSSPLDENVSVSSTFHPQAQLHVLAPNLALVSSDAVVFHVHSHIILGASTNRFRSLLPTPTSHKTTVLRVNESSCLLNIILCSIYDLPTARFALSLPTLVAAVNRLPVYGISPNSCITLSSSLFYLLLSHAPKFPLELYALAASHDIYDLAASASLHLLSLDLASLTDDMASLIGSVYLKRLFFLHFGRLNALKRILLPPPTTHPPTLECTFTEQQKNLTRAWALASAYLAWDARPDLTTSAMETALQPLAQHLSCDQCQQALFKRIHLLVTQWSAVKETI